jgi:excisionase family DNA binding protein
MKGCAVAAPPSGKAAPQLSRYLHTAEVADILQVSPKTVTRWAKEGKLPFLRTLGGHRRCPAAEIRQLAEKLRVQPTAQPGPVPPGDHGAQHPPRRCLVELRTHDGMVGANGGLADLHGPLWFGAGASQVVRRVTFSLRGSGMWVA